MAKVKRMTKLTKPSIAWRILDIKFRASLLLQLDKKC